MKVKTSNGEIELTAEMVRPGMVFEGFLRHTITGLIRPDRSDAWKDTEGRALIGFEIAHMRFLGCDPAIALREDCALYGIAPAIDAGAHGFARLQDGGAVDLWREYYMPPGSIIVCADGTRARYHYAPTMLLEGERWDGLDARHARPEDVRRLCCLNAYAFHGMVHVNSHGPIRCTLAIGDHDEHEDIAAGMKWPAKQGLDALLAKDPIAQAMIQSRAAKAAFDDLPTLTIGQGVEAITFPCVSAVLSTTLEEPVVKAEVIIEHKHIHALTAFSRWVQSDGCCEVKVEGVSMRAIPKSVSRDTLAPGVERFRLTLVEAAVVGADGGFRCPATIGGLPSPEPRRISGILGLGIKLNGTFDLRASITFGETETACCTVYEDGEVRCSCGGATLSADLIAHEKDCKVQPWAREAARLVIVAARVARGFTAACGAAAAAALSLWLVKAWDASPPGQLATRDAEVAKAIANVPDGCDAKGWANVVRVLAADNWDRPDPAVQHRARLFFPQYFGEEVADARESISAYARARFVFGYSPAEALRWVLEAEATREGSDPGTEEPGAVKLAERLFAAYEAGR